MISRADIFVDTEALLENLLAFAFLPFPQGPFAALLVQHAFGGGDDDLGAGRIGGQCLAQGVTHACDIICPSIWRTHVAPIPLTASAIELLVWRFGGHCPR